MSIQNQASIIELGSQFDAVNRMDDVEQFCRKPGFVRLKVANEVPFEFGKGAYFGLGFLHAALTELMLSDSHCFRNGVEWKCLTHGQKSHVVGRTPAGSGSIFYLVSNAPQIVCDLAHSIPGCA